MSACALILTLFTCLAQANLIIFDHDGGVDDFQALIKLLQFQISTNHSQHKLIGITTVRGNIETSVVHNISRSVLALFRPFSPTQLDDIRVYQGSESPLLFTPIPPRFAGHGTNGMGNFEFPAFRPNTTSNAGACDHNANIHASLGILELIKTHHTKDKIDVIAVGPLTNIALALKLDSTAFSKINSLWMMGGAVYAQGNAKSMGEYNFVNDVEAAKIVMDHSQLLKIYVVPIDAMRRYPLKQIEAILNEMTAAKESKFMQHMIWNMNQFWLEYLRKRTNSWPNSPGFVLPDLDAVTAYLYPQQVIENMVEVNADIELCGTHSRGAVAIDWQNGVKTEEEFERLSEEEKRQIEHKWWVSNRHCNRGDKKENDKICVIEQMNHEFVLQEFKQMTEFECPHCFALYEATST